jgi:hypothetical protein
MAKLQGGHDAWRAGGADLGAVFVVVQVGDPVQTVFDQPVAADDGCEFSRTCLGGGKRRDRVDGLIGPFLLAGQLAPAHDLDGLRGVRDGLHRAITPHANPDRSVRAIMSVTE